MRECSRTVFADQARHKHSLNIGEFDDRQRGGFETQSVLAAGLRRVTHALGLLVLSGPPALGDLASVHHALQTSRADVVSCDGQTRHDKDEKQEKGAYPKKLSAKPSP